MSSEGCPKPLSIFFIPWFATGHLIPLVDIARLFASRSGVTSTILLTPANAALIEYSSTRNVDPAVNILTYPFPAAESGLPPGFENLASFSRKDTYKIDLATPHARPALERLLRLHRPDAVVADAHFGWTASVAHDLRIPKLIFHAIGMFPVCVLGNIMHRGRQLLADSSTSTVIDLLDLPHPVRMVRSELPEFVQIHVPEMSSFLEETEDDKNTAMGAIVNSFFEIEHVYAQHAHRTAGLRSWFVGPVSLAAASDRNELSDPIMTAWLDEKPPGSVVFVCFGSWPHFTDEQMREIGSALESCGHPFLWVVREGYEPPTSPPPPSQKDGMVVKGWAPQVAILSHPAVGGFVTHCGWNSLLEGVSAGLPMVTWPLKTEQFINERLVVDVLRIGVKNWEGFRSTFDEKKVTVKAEDFAESLRRIMDVGSEEADGMRKRAKEYGEMARAAVVPGGSSYDGLSSLIHEIRAFKSKDV